MLRECECEFVRTKALEACTWLCERPAHFEELGGVLLNELQRASTSPSLARSMLTGLCERLGTAVKAGRCDVTVAVLATLTDWCLVVPHLMDVGAPCPPSSCTFPPSSPCRARRVLCRALPGLVCAVRTY